MRHEKFDEFMSVTMSLSDEQLQAMDGLIPMTGELFEKCIEKCTELGAPEYVSELAGRYPEFYRQYLRKEEKEDGLSAADALQSDVVWKKLMEQLERAE